MQEHLLPSLAFGRNSKAGSGVGNLYGKAEGVSYALTGGCWHGKAGIGHLMWLLWEAHVTFSHWSCSEVDRGAKIGKVEVIDQIMTVLGQLLQK